MNTEDRYFDLRALAGYSGLSVDTLRRYMRDPEHPLPHHQLRASGKKAGRVLVRKQEFDAWVASFGGMQPPEKPEPSSLAADARAIVQSIRGR